MSQTSEGEGYEDLPTDTEYTEKTRYSFLVGSSAEEEGDDSFFSPSRLTYRTEDFISRPSFSENCDIEENILEFDFSYGYDCKKPYNLVAVDEKTIIFASGNLIHFLDYETREIWFRRSALGSGIGHIAKNPNSAYPHIAVGENGIDPPIIIYLWPSLEIVCLLKGGTGRRYSHLNYNPDGDLLVSQGLEPDYFITIWKWKESTILLRAKSYVNDVLRVMFAPDIPDHLVSCGVAHIKFWKMAETFTGLKLKGELGRFGKTEYSDIVGIYPMADEKVISGCYWGNILVWEEGLIKAEVCRKNRKRCHDGPIVQFHYKDGELWTIGMDGRVRMWYYDTIDQADPPDDDRFILMEPTYDFYTPGAMFMCIEKQHVDPEDTFYFAQDAKGAIWRIDLSIEREAQPSERILKSHAGVAVSLAVCPWGPYYITLGIGGWIHLYNYVTRTLLNIVLFPAKGCCLLWFPMDVEPSGEAILVALDDGTLRICIWKINLSDEKGSKMYVNQITKPHTKTITALLISRDRSILATGSEDCTIFVSAVDRRLGKYISLSPIGYVPFPEGVSCLTWHNTWNSTVIVGGCHGQIMIVQLPTEQQSYTKITYVLKVEPIYQQFKTYKSQILRDIEIREIEERKAEKRARKMEELNQVRKENPGLDIDEDVFLADSVSEEELPPLYVPPVPNRIRWIQHTQDDTLWVSMGGYDAGYIYEYELGQKDSVPVRFTPITGAFNLEINNYCYSKNGEYVVFGMENGAIRLNRLNKTDWRNLDNYWQLTMHDNNNGYIPGMSFSYDEKYLVTCGHDGNVFTFRFYPENTEEGDYNYKRIVPNASALHHLENTDCYAMLSFEETVVKAEQDRINALANANKEAYMEELQALRERYETFLERNANLPPSQQLTPEELDLDPRVTADLQQKLDADLALVKRKFEFDVEKSLIRMNKLKSHFVETVDFFPFIVYPVNRPLEMVTILKQELLTDLFYQNLEMVDVKIVEADQKGRPPERPPAVVQQATAPPKTEKKLEYFLVGLPPEVIEKHLGVKINSLLAKYRKRKSMREERAKEWAVFNAQKPSEKATDNEDEEILRSAEESIGDYKLKSSSNYKVPKHMRETVFKKYKELLLLRKRQFDLIHGLNKTVSKVRDMKCNLHQYIEKQTKVLEELHQEINPADHLFGPPPIKFHNKQFPELEFVVNVTMPTDKVEPLVEKRIVPDPDKNVLRSMVLLVLENQEIEEENYESKWEKELRMERITSKLGEQQEIIKMMETAIEDFDETVVATRASRIDVTTQSSIMKAHMMTLAQELIILKDCEDKEDDLSEKVHVNMVELLDMKDVTGNFSNKIDITKKDIDKLLEKEKEIQKNFQSAVAESKFADFLRRIFKKKYRPVKSTDEETDSDSSSSSSEESEDEDAASIDSKDFNIIRLDENICPKGCDPNLYDLTFQLRRQRHALEQEVKDLTTVIDVTSKDLQLYQKKMRAVSANLKSSQEELDAFQRDKQSKLNQIFCLTILKMHQIQNLDDSGRQIGHENSLVFDRRQLSKLYKRVGLLSNETLEQLAKHHLSITHLNRMRADQKFMLTKIAALKKDIKQRMREKFGSPANIDDLEEYMLKRLIFKLRLSQLKIAALYKEEEERWYNIHKEKQKELYAFMKTNTNLQDLLSMLSLEKNKLRKSLDHQRNVSNNYEEMLAKAEDMKNEIRKLEKVVQEQNKELETLKREIKIYKTKGYILRPEVQHEVFVPEAVEEESQVSEWDDIDDYMYTETYAKEYWANKELQKSVKTRQDVIMSILEELFENVNVEVHEKDVVRILQSVISNVMTKSDMEQIIKDLLECIPGPHTDEQQSLIELAAEKLCSIDYEEAEINSKEILMQIIEDIFESEIAAEQIVQEVATILMDTLTLDAILEPENISAVVGKISSLMDREEDEVGEEFIEAIKSRVEVMPSQLADISEEEEEVDEKEVDVEEEEVMKGEVEEEEEDVEAKDVEEEEVEKVGEEVEEEEVETKKAGEEVEEKEVETKKAEEEIEEEEVEAKEEEEEEEEEEVSLVY